MTMPLDRKQWKIILLSSLGGTLEFYDFIIFVIFAASIGRCFFPANNPMTSLLDTFAVFAVGYLARPVGGFFFSHFGDRYGRKTVFIISMLIMAFATFFMSILPGYSTWGMMASILFVCLRLLQGLAIGGEIPGAIVFVKEHIEARPGLACGIIFLFINLGIFLASLVHGILSPLVSEEYAWRIAFFMGGILAIFSYFLRRTLHESVEFTRTLERFSVPLFVLMRKYFSLFLRGFFIVACQATLIAIFYLYVTSFMELQKYATSDIAWITTINLAVFSLGCAVWGGLSDYVGQRILMIVGALLSIPLAVFFYQALATHQHVMPIYLLLSVTASMYTGSFSAYVAKLFPVNVRFSGVAASYNLAFAIFGGLSPLAATYLIKILHHSIAPSYIFVFGATLGVAAIFSTKNLSRL